MIDYTKAMKKAGAYGSENLLKSQGKEKDVLLLRKLEKPVKRFDGKTARYELEHRELSVICENDSDEAYVCVSSSETTLWMLKEVKDALRKNANLFDTFKITLR